MLRGLIVLACLTLSLSGCLKTDAKAVLNADGSGTVNYDAAYKLDAIEEAKGRIEEMKEQADESGRGGDRIAQAEDRLAKFQKSFEADAVTADLKAKGFEVISAKSYEDNGYKGVKVEAKYTDINQVLARVRETREAARAEAEAQAGGEGGEGRGGRGRGRGMARMGGGTETDPTPLFVSAFEKTTDAKIGKAVITAPRQAGRGGQMGGGRGGRAGGGGGGMNQGMEDYRRSLKLTLPGKIVEAQNCKKEGENTLVIDLKGTDLMPDEEGELPSVARNGISVTFEIPENCKINFADPVGAKKPEGQDKAPAPDEKKERKGDLKIGG